MSVKVIIPGPLSTLQDLGRFGYQAGGFSPAGAVDPDALRAANLLVGNVPGEAAIEMNLLGVTVQFTEDCVIAVTGGTLPVMVNGNPVPMYRALALKKNDYLYCGNITRGMRAYLAVAGGFDVPVIMGSRSTGVKFSVGGFEGRSLRSGDLLNLRKPSAELPHMDRRALPLPEFPEELVLRAIPGPQAEKLGAEALKVFFSSEYKVSQSADRMGLRLDGSKIPSADGYDIISDGTSHGAVQVSNDGTPIILMNDRQTTGGYAKAAGVISADLPLAGQAVPGTRVRFAEVTARQAEDALRKKMTGYEKLYQKINGRKPGKEIL